MECVVSFLCSFRLPIMALYSLLSWVFICTLSAVPCALLYNRNSLRPILMEAVSGVAASMHRIVAIVMMIVVLLMIITLVLLFFWCYYEVNLLHKLCNDVFLHTDCSCHLLYWFHRVCYLRPEMDLPRILTTILQICFKGSHGNCIFVLFHFHNLFPFSWSSLFSSGITIVQKFHY